MELDQSVLATLPIQQRQKVCQQIRQKQIEKCIQFEKTEGRTDGPKERNNNKKRTVVHFQNHYMLQDAIDNFDDREVLKQLTIGGNANFSTGNGTTLLHRCAQEDNVSASELLLGRGADVNIVDDDWWTPLHTACNCDSIEVLQYLLNNGADVMATDVDGYFPIDHAQDGSEAKAVMTKYLESQGLSREKLHEVQQTRPRGFLDHIKTLPLATDVNQLNTDGVTLLHIAAANGYKSAMKALWRYDPEVDALDNYGWTPLHVAARFNQMKSVEMLLKHKANPNIVDLLGSKPSAVTSSDEIRGLLMKFERKFDSKSPADAPDQPFYLEFTDDSADNVYHEIDIAADEGLPSGNLVGVFRINSKTVRPKHVTISKEDELSEARQMYESIGDWKVDKPPRVAPGPVPSIDEEADDDDDDYVSTAIWKTGAQEQGNLQACMANDNLTSVGNVQDDIILSELWARYTAEQIYTYIGDILLAVNPFKELPYYAKSISLKYHSFIAGVKLPPHIYGIAENSYSALLREQKSQCHVISGESGSGKTESCKYIVQHLLRVAGSDETSLSSKINQVNPLLEGFGNAITMMNNNSSRFGKFVELNFTGNGKVTGARISEYLLEKSRIAHQGAGECNFHIFYWMLAGLSPEEVKVYRLENMKDLRYLKGSDGNTSQFINKANKEKFWETKECLKFIGFSQQDVQNVFLTLSTVLHLGEITFVGAGNNEAAQVQNSDILRKVSDLLEVSSDEFGSALVAEYTVTRGEQIRKERTQQQAEDCRDALAKTLYCRLFSWIVNGINQLIQPAIESADLQIGILDIFGFENFPRNSFEQMCINLANEQIQLYTNDHIFYEEQQDCLLEGVPLVELNYSSNQSILDLFLERHTGVLAIMDEESTFPKATDKSLATKLHQVTGKKHWIHYKTPKDGGKTFTVIHYAGSVTYDVVGVLEKNRDTLPNSILHTMKTSNRLLIKELFHSRITRTGSLAPSARQQRSRRTTMKKTASPFEFFKKFKAGKQDKKPQAGMSPSQRKGPSTMAFHFRNSLSDLVSKLQSSTPHFVRCLKPNSTKAALTFVPEYVVAQLRYTGISDVVKIRKCGYAMRLTFHEFLTRYPVLVSCALPRFAPMTDENKCWFVLKHFRVEDVQSGKTKLFFRKEQMDKLDRITRQSMKKVTTVQSVIRGFLGRQKSKHVRQRIDEQKKLVKLLMHNVTDQGRQLEIQLHNVCHYDREERQLTLKKKEIAEITKSLESLDTLLDTYDSIGAVTSPIKVTNVISEVTVTESQTEEEEDETEYDDAFSWQPAGKENDDQTGDNMNGHLQRGLPPTPTHKTYTDPQPPPPCPREMYAGTYNDFGDQYTEKRDKPPPPKRNPETRLSTTSIGSTSSSSGTYEEISVLEDQSPRHQRHHDANQSPHHVANGSPVNRPKYTPDSQSSPSRPFSYGANVMSPKHKKTDQNGSNRPNVQQEFSYQYNTDMVTDMNGHGRVLHNYQYDEHSGSPAASYGKQESTFHTQPKKPAPVHPPPPPPPTGGHPGYHQSPPPLPGGHPQSPPPLPGGHPQSPPIHPMGHPGYQHHKQRHSVATIESNVRQPRLAESPERIPRLSQRSKSVPCNPDDELLLANPPPPVAVMESYMAALSAQRSQSPPLPPPPPEMMVTPRNSYELPQPATHDLVPQPQHHHKGLPVSPPRVPNTNAPPAPMAPPQSFAPHAPQAPAPPPIASIPKSNKLPNAKQQQQTRGGDSTVNIAKGGNANGGRVGSPARAARDQSPVPSIIGELKGVQLRKTGLKPADPVPTPPREPSPPPPSPIIEEQRSPSPPLAQVTAKANVFEKKAEELAVATTKLEEAKARRRSDTSNSSKMEIDLDDIDFDDIPGYSPITNATPIWKRDVIERKNREKLEEYIENRKRDKEEADKWKNVPEWKRKLMVEKDKEKRQKDVQVEKQAAEEAIRKKKQSQVAEDDKRRRQKEQQEYEKQMEEELKSLPAWKREVMMKRGGGIKNWGDERAEINEQVETE